MVLKQKRRHGTNDIQNYKTTQSQPPTQKVAQLQAFSPSCPPGPYPEAKPLSPSAAFFARCFSAHSLLAWRPLSAASNLLFFAAASLSFFSFSISSSAFISLM